MMVDRLSKWLGNQKCRLEERMMCFEWHNESFQNLCGNGRGTVGSSTHYKSSKSFRRIASSQLSYWLAKHILIYAMYFCAQICLGIGNQIRRVNWLASIKSQRSCSTSDSSSWPWWTDWSPFFHHKRPDGAICITQLLVLINCKF